MLILKTIILGIVEGFTEFLPISSTAHLILIGKLLGIPQTEYWKFFTVFIQSGAILAVVWAYWSRFKNQKMLVNLMASFIPTALIGLFFYKIIKNVFFESTLLIIFTLFIFGVIFILLETLIKKKSLKLTKKLDQLSLQEAVIVGVIQAMAIIPGVSRAGSVLIGGILMGYTRKEIALYSFLLAVPTILAASVLDLLKTNPIIIMTNLPLTMLGFITAFITAYLVVRWLITYLQKHDLKLFGWYRIIFALLLLLILFV